MLETPITIDEATKALRAFEAKETDREKLRFLSPEARVMITDALLQIVNTPCIEHGKTYCECPRPRLRNHAGIYITKTPSERLSTFVDAFIRIPGGWTGIAEMEAVYGSLFPPGDGVERGSPATPGYRWADNETGTHVPLLTAVPEDTKLLEQPEDVLTDEERRKLADQFTKALERVSGGSSCEE